MVNWPRSLTLLLATFLLSLGLAFATLAIWIALRYKLITMTLIIINQMIIGMVIISIINAADLQTR